MKKDKRFGLPRNSGRQGENAFERMRDTNGQAGERTERRVEKGKGNQLREGPGGGMEIKRRLKGPVKKRANAV